MSAAHGMQQPAFEPSKNCLVHLSNEHHTATGGHFNVLPVAGHFT